MKASWFRSLAIASAVILTCICIAGCEEATEPEQEQEQEEVSNPNAPGNNNAIVYEHVFGDTEKRNSIWMMDDDGAGGYYFSGLYGSYYSFGRMGADGGLLWSERARYSPRELEVLELTVVPAISGVIGVGARDSDGDGDSDYGYVGVYSPEGTLVDEMLFSSDEGDVWLNSLEYLSDSTFVVVGGKEIADTEYPFLARVSVTSSGTLIKHEETSIESLPNVFFLNVMKQDDPNPGPTATLFAVGEKWPSGGGSGNVTVHGLTVDIDSIEQVSVEWTRHIVLYPGLTTEAHTGDAAIYDGQHIYVVGSTEHPKEPRPTNDYWDAGFAASVSPLGDLEWIKVVNLSQYGDEFYSVFLAQDGLYAVGAYSRFYNPPTTRHFGYGLLSKLNPTTGAVIANMTFGDPTYSSGLNTVRVEPGSAHCAGWTDYKTRPEGYDCWYAEIDVSARSQWLTMVPKLAGRVSLGPVSPRDAGKQLKRNGSGIR